MKIRLPILFQKTKKIEIRPAQTEYFAYKQMYLAAKNFYFGDKTGDWQRVHLIGYAWKYSYTSQSRYCRFWAKVSKRQLTAFFAANFQDSKSEVKRFASKFIKSRTLKKTNERHPEYSK